MITQAQLDDWFTYYPPEDNQVELYKLVRNAGRAFAEVIIASTPPCADQTAAVRKVREAVMTANAAIACKGV